MTEPASWQELNQRHLMTALQEVRLLLERREASFEEREDAGPAGSVAATGMEDWDEAYAPPALERISEIFELTSFERKVLLLCAGPDLVGSFASLCAAAQGDPRRTYPTFSLALAAFPDAHWSALTPSAPLRFWCLIEVVGEDPLTAARLRIDERILHFLAGVSHGDERLSGLMEVPSRLHSLVPSHERIARVIAAAWTNLSHRVMPPVIELAGGEVSDKEDIAGEACAALGLRLCVIAAHALPVDLRDLEEVIRLWDREAALDSYALLLRCDELTAHDAGFPTVMRAIARARGLLLVSSRDRICRGDRAVLSFDIEKPPAREQQMLWEETLGSLLPKTEVPVDGLVHHFNLGSRAIRKAVEMKVVSGDASTLWDHCRVLSRPRLETLAQRVEAVASWDDLVLPAPQIQALREISLQVRQRARVYGVWGFGAASSRGLGISALFEGASGTGKTMAAEVLANELRLDLYRIDLSQVVSKYIGETEKNLRQVFDCADSGGAILLFDEADALFGKRSEISDSHDRYANIEVSYLLQRMEMYRGLAILTTNMKGAIDTAFMRRIRFVVQFPFPEAGFRAEIWRRVFPPQTPTEGLDIDKLARLSVSGGNIRNIALNAAFLAADDGGKVRMTHLLQAARGEYAKLEKQLSAAEVGGWV